MCEQYQTGQFFSSCQKCIFTHSHPLVLDKVALQLLGILAGQGGHGGKGSHPEILDLEAFQVFEDPRNRVWVQSGMTPIHAGQLFNPFFQSKGFITTRESRRLFLCAIAFG